jgi:cell division protein FtsB
MAIVLRKSALMGDGFAPKGGRGQERRPCGTNQTAEMAKRRIKQRKRIPRGRFLVRWLVLAVLGFVAFLYYQPLRSYVDTRDALEERSAEVQSLRAEKRSLEHRLVEADTPAALAREARRLGYVKPGERLFIVKGIDAWRRAQALKAKRTDRR